MKTGSTISTSDESLKRSPLYFENQQNQLFPISFIGKHKNFSLVKQNSENDQN